MTAFSIAVAQLNAFSRCNCRHGRPKPPSNLELRLLRNDAQRQNQRRNSSKEPSKKSVRSKTPRETETDILLQCGRRCCLCFGLLGDFEPKRGQIAHIDRNASNSAAPNLVYLCLPHHDEYDSRTSQSKGFTIDELKAYRERLVAKVCERVGPEQKLRELIDQQTLEEELVCGGTDRLEEEKDAAKIVRLCLDRLHRLANATNSYHEGLKSIPFDLPDEDMLIEIENIRTRCLLENSIPKETYGIDGEMGPDEEWFSTIEALLRGWARGVLSHAECGELHWEIDEGYDLDYYYVLFGIPHGLLSAISIRYLTAFVFVFGSRNFVTRSEASASDQEVPF